MTTVMTGHRPSRDAVRVQADSTGVEVVRRVRHRLRRRTVIVSLALVVFLLGMFCLALTVGDFPVSVQQVWLSLTGRGTRATATCFSAPASSSM